MTASYGFIVAQIKETHELYQNLVKAGLTLDEYENTQKEKIEELYKVVLELEESKKV